MKVCPVCSYVIIRQHTELANASAQVHPVGAIVLGLALMISELFVPSFGALGIGGVAGFVVGSIMIVPPTGHDIVGA